MYNDFSKSAARVALLLLYINNAAAVTSVWERTSVFKNHELTEFQYSKFSKLQLVVRTTLSKVLDNTGEDAYFRQSASSKKKKKIHRYPSATTLGSNSVLI